MSGERLGIFGGTFDPPHLGHLVTAVNVRHELDLDRILLVVNHQPWQKLGTRDISPATDRLAMVESAVAGVERLEACDVEIVRGGMSYTADTLTEINRRHPASELFVILGTDAAAGIETWERADEVRRQATVVVVDRPGAHEGSLPHGWSWARVEVPRLEVSSTDLRARVADGRPLDYLLPDGVVDTIRRRHLYQTGAVAGIEGAELGRRV